MSTGGREFRWWPAVVLVAALLSSAAVPAPPLGKPAPPFTLHLFDGRQVLLKDFRGKPVLLNFWHSG